MRDSDRRCFIPIMRPALFLSAVAWSAVIACGSEATTKPISTDAPSALGIRIQGSGQRALAGEPLANRVGAQVVDSSSRVVAGRRRIRFSIAEGDGSISDTVVLSSESGFASVNWVLGKTSGEQQLTVRLVDSPSTTEQRIVATAVPLSAADVVLITGATSGTIGVLVRKDAGIVPYTLLWPDTVLRLLPRSADGTSEEVTAFTVGHPPVAVLQPWTDGVDTVRSGARRVLGDADDWASSRPRASRQRSVPVLRMRG